MISLLLWNVHDLGTTYVRRRGEKRDEESCDCGRPGYMMYIDSMDLHAMGQGFVRLLVDKTWRVMPYAGQACSDRGLR